VEQIEARVGRRFGCEAPNYIVHIFLPDPKGSLHPGAKIEIGRPLKDILRQLDPLKAGQGKEAHILRVIAERNKILAPLTEQHRKRAEARVAAQKPSCARAMIDSDPGASKDRFAERIQGFVWNALAWTRSQRDSIRFQQRSNVWL
jgi:hypothetical protein